MTRGVSTLDSDSRSTERLVRAGGAEIETLLTTNDLILDVTVDRRVRPVRPQGDAPLG